MRAVNNNLESIKGVKELLIVVDMVNGFIEEGALKAPNIKRIVGQQIKKINEFLLGDNKGIIFIRDSHTNNAIEFKRYPSHCLQNSHESELIDELKIYEKDAITYFKNSTNFIYALNSVLLKFTNLEKVYVIGCLSEVCVFDGATSLRTFFDEYNKDIEVYVYEDMIDTYDDINHKSEEVNKMAIDLMKQKGIKVIKENYNENI